jgi:anti-anti-sigma factor
MDIGSENHGQVLLLRPEGRLDTETAGELELALHDAFESGRRHFVLDLARISYVSSAGLRVLLALAKKLDGDIGSLRLAALNASVKQVFDIAGFTTLFDIRSNHKAALDKHPFAAATTSAPAPGTMVSTAASLLGATEPAAVASAEQKATADAAARLLGVGVTTGAAAKGDAPNRATVVGGPADPRLQAAAEQAESAQPKEPAPAAKPGMFSRLLGKK